MSLLRPASGESDGFIVSDADVPAVVHGKKDKDDQDEDVDRGLVGVDGTVAAAGLGFLEPARRVVPLHQVLTDTGSSKSCVPRTACLLAVWALVVDFSAIC